MSFPTPPTPGMGMYYPPPVANSAPVPPVTSAQTPSLPPWSPPTVNLPFDIVGVYLQNMGIPDTPESRKEAWALVGKVVKRMMENEGIEDSEESDDDGDGVGVGVGDGGGDDNDTTDWLPADKRYVSPVDTSNYVPLKQPEPIIPGPLYGQLQTQPQPQMRPSTCPPNPVSYGIPHANPMYVNQATPHTVHSAQFQPRPHGHGRGISQPFEAIGGSSPIHSPFVPSIPSQMTASSTSLSPSMPIPFQYFATPSGPQQQWRKPKYTDNATIYRF